MHQKDNGDPPTIDIATKKGKSGFSRAIPLRRERRDTTSSPSQHHIWPLVIIFAIVGLLVWLVRSYS